MPIFLYGPLCWEPIAACILGDEFTKLSREKACLPGYELQEPESHWWPVISAKEGCVSGEILRGLSKQATERIEFIAKGMGVELATLPIRHDSQMIEAISLIPAPRQPAPHTPWHFENWKKHWGQQALWIVKEAMDYFGKITGDELHHRFAMIASRAAARWAARAGAPARIRSKFSAEQVELIGQSTPHAGFFLTRAYQICHPGFDGTLSPPLHREVFVASDAAIILPYDPVRDRVLLVEQFRMGPFGRGDPLPWMLEPVAGRVDIGEDPAETARRECLEEAGVTLAKIEHISSYYCSPGCSTEYFHCYLGLCDLPELKQGRGGLAAEHEDIRTHILDFEQAMQLIASGEANNGPLILSLIWLARERARLRNCA